MSHSRQTAREESQCTTNSLSLTSSPITPSPHLSLIHHDCKLYCPGAEAVSRLRVLGQFLPRGGSHYDGSERETDRPHCMSEHSQRHTPTHLLLVCGTPYCPACITPNVHCTAEREVCHHCTIPGLLGFIFTTHTTLHTPSPPLLTTHLVSHLDQAAQSEFEYHAPLEGDKVPYIFKDEESRTVVVAVAEVGDYK